mgnify:FL=1
MSKFHIDEEYYNQDVLIKAMDFMEYIDMYEIANKKNLSNKVSDGITREIFEMMYRG